VSEILRNGEFKLFFIQYKILLMLPLTSELSTPLLRLC
jgi:hypothetical protein